MESWRVQKPVCWLAAPRCWDNGRLIVKQGNGLNVIKIMPESAIKFGSFEVREYAGLTVGEC